MRKLLCFLFLAGAASLAAVANAPKLLVSSPSQGGLAVAVDIGVIRLHFDRSMNQDTWTLWQSAQGKFPPMEGTNDAPWRDPQTFELRIQKLEPDTTYAIQLNSSKRQGFVSADGQMPLEITTLVFHTAPAQTEAAAPLAPTAAPAPDAVAAQPQTPVPGPESLPEQHERAMDLGPARPDPKRVWTVLIYMAGDNDLESAALDDLNEIESALPGQGVEVVVLVDRAKEYDDSDGDWTETRVYRMRAGKDAKALESEKLAELGELNLGAPETLQAFVAAGFEAFPAQRHALVMWDHGAGWSAEALDSDATGATDGTDSLTLPELRSALQAGLAAAKIPKLDIVAFDMCLMGQLELAVQLQPLADILVASEALVPGDGLPYDQVIGEFASSLPPAEIAKHVVEAYGRYYEAAKDRSATLSAVDLARVPDVVSALDSVARKLQADAARAWPSLSRSLFFAESYVGRGDYRLGQAATASVDLLDVLKRMRAAVQGFPATAELDRLEQALKHCVLSSYAGRQRRLSNGLAVYAPVRGEMLHPDYAQIDLAQKSGWLDLLRKVHEGQKSQLAAPKITKMRLLSPQGAEVDRIQSLGGATVEITLEGNNILWTVASEVQKIDEPAGYAVMFRSFIFDPRYDERKKQTAANLADLVMPEYVDGKNVLKKEMGGLAIRVTDGKRAYGATADLSDPDDVLHARVPALYSHPDTGTVPVDIYFDVSWSVADQIVAFLKQPNGSYVRRRIKPEPAADITLLYEVLTEDGKGAFAKTGTVKWGEGLRLVMDFEEPGQYAMIVDAESIGGVSDSEVLPYTLQENAGLKALTREGANYGAEDLVGDWVMQSGTLKPGTQELEFTATPITVSFTKDPENSGLLRYAFAAPGAKEMLSGLAMVDHRGAPALVYFSKNDEGELVRSDLHLAFKIVENGRPTFVLKDVLLGPVYRLVRAGKAPAPASLDGTWQNDEGFTIVIAGDRYETYTGFQLVDRGSYTVSGTQITSRSEFGSVELYQFELSGDTLTLVDQMGTRLVLTRSGMQGATDGSRSMPSKAIEGLPFEQGVLATAAASGRIVYTRHEPLPVAGAEALGSPGVTRLYVMNGEGQEQRPWITVDGVVFAEDPQWSVDGKSVLFSSNHRKVESALFMDVFIANADATGLRRITGDSGPMPAGGPPGTILGRIIDDTGEKNLPGTDLSVGSTLVDIAWKGGQGRFEDLGDTFRISGVPAGTVWVRATRSKHVGAMQVVQVPAGGQATVELRLTSGNFMATRPSLSPDGRFIVIQSGHAYYDPNGKYKQAGFDTIAVLDAQSGQTLAMWEPTRMQGQLAKDPRLSPDGQWIAFSMGLPPTESIAVCSLQGLLAGQPDVRVIVPGQQVLGAGGYGNVGPAWSPDGRRLAFTRYFMGTQGLFGNLFVVNLDGTGARQITQVSGNQCTARPSWSPDGRRIACQLVTSRRSVLEFTDLILRNFDSDIWTTGADGSLPRQLTRDGRSAEPAWGP